MKMKKRRILSLLLAFVLVMNMIPMPNINAFAETQSEEKCTCGYIEYIKEGDYYIATAGDSDMAGHDEACPLYEGEADECTCESEVHKAGCALYIEAKSIDTETTQTEETKADSGEKKSVSSAKTLTGTATTTSASGKSVSEAMELDFSSYVGETAKFNLTSEEINYIMISATASNATEDYEMVAVEDIPDDLIVEVSGWKIDEYDILWYKVVVAKESTTIFEALETYPWVFQCDTSIENDPESLIFIESDAEDTAKPGELTETTESGYVVNVNGAFIEDIALSVKEVTAKATLPAHATKQMFALDIKLLDADEKEWQPEEAVTVSLDAASFGLNDGDVIGIVHEHEGEFEDLGLFFVKDDTVSFEVDGFSNFYGYTVDFEYGGVWHSINGGSSIELSKLFTILGIEKDVQDITNVVFSDTTLVEVSELESGDWKLQSLQAFTSEEKLVITFIDGTAIDINVYDAFIDVSNGLDYELYYKKGALYETADATDPSVAFPYQRANESANFYQVPLFHVIINHMASLNQNFITSENYNYTTPGSLTIYVMETYEVLGSEIWGESAVSPETQQYYPDVNIVRHESLGTDPMIQVHTPLNNFLVIQDEVTIDNKSMSDESIAILCDTSTSCTIMAGGDVTNTVAKNGIGIELTGNGSVELRGPYVDTNNADVDNFANGKTDFSNLKIAIDQQQGKTRLQEGPYTFTDNFIDIRLADGQTVGKWAFDLETKIKVTLENNDISVWKNGSIIMDSGQYARAGSSAVATYPEYIPENYRDIIDNKNNTYIPVYVEPKDLDIITIVNGEGQVQAGLYLEYWEGETYLGNENAHAAYIRYTGKKVVHNVELDKWYFTLGEAFLDEGLEDGHTLVFHGGTFEKDTVTATHDVTILAMPNPYRGYYDAVWGATYRENGKDTNTTDTITGDSCLVIPNGVTVTFGGGYRGAVELLETGKVDVDIYDKGLPNSVSAYARETEDVNTNFDKILLDANTNDQNKARVIEVQSGGALVVLNDLAIYGGDPKKKGSGVYQNGKFYVSGAPEFNELDVYLPNSETDDDNEATRVITKLGAVSSKIPVTLGGNQYDGRNYVVTAVEDIDGTLKGIPIPNVGSVSGQTVANGDLDLFPVSNVATGLETIYNSADKHRNNQPVLELEIITGDLQIEKTVVKEYTYDPWEGDTFNFTVTAKNANAILPDGNYPIVINYNNADKNVVATVEKGILKISSDKLPIEVTETNSVVSILIKGLPVGEYTVAEVSKPGYEVSPESQDTTILKDKTSTVEFKNKFNQITGNLKISKTVTNVYGSADTPGKEFNFTVTFNSKEKLNYKVYDSNNSQQSEGTIASGDSVKLNAGHYILILGVPKGEYTVKETDIPVYYELNSVTVDGDAVSSLSEPVKGTIVAKNTSHVEFNNNYKPLGNLKVTKSVEASANSILPPPEGDTFSFTFTPSIEGEYKWEKFDKNGVEIGTGGTIKSGKTFQLESEQSFVVYGLPAGEACTITEVAVDNYEVEGGAGKSVTIVKDDTVEVSFKNIYTAPTGDLMITKTVINQSGSEIPASISNEFAFTFVLTDGTKPITQSFGYTISGTGSVVEDTGNIGKISNGNTIRLQGGASILIADLPAGAMYTVIETIPDDFAFSVNKAENTGTIESKKTVQVGVVNTYPAEKVGSLTITKELAEGTTCEADQTFLFKVTGPDEFEMDVVIRGTGSVKIDDLPLGEYTVTEDVKWSWRYELASGSASQTVELSTSQTEATTTFTNKLKDGGEKWLSGTAYADNNYTGNFNGTGSSTSSGTTSYVPSIFAISVTTTKGAAGNDEEE